MYHPSSTLLNSLPKTFNTRIKVYCGSASSLSLSKAPRNLWTLPPLFPLHQGPSSEPLTHTQRREKKEEGDKWETREAAAAAAAADGAAHDEEGQNARAQARISAYTLSERGTADLHTHRLCSRARAYGNFPFLRLLAQRARLRFIIHRASKLQAIAHVSSSSCV